ncbi:DUP family protein [Prochlorococcus marinus]|uniref:DUP family protein n=1 Tax=Prochlorococcus marinus TaxID=1219 RepID=UPI0022B54F33|nr:DUP family protein [Prochlorococcus marinus]
MESINHGSDPLKDFTDKQLSDLEESIDILEQEDANMICQDLEDKKRMISTKKPFMRLRKSPVEIFNRLLFLVFLGSFIFSFFLVYNYNSWCFFFYLISAFSCILYTPNRKAIKELLDAWPNILTLIKNKN